MAEAAKHRAEHRVSRALPLLERAVEVLDSSMGKGNVLAEGACVYGGAMGVWMWIWLLVEHSDRRIPT